VAIFEPVVEKRINERKEKLADKKARDMMNALIDVEDESYGKLSRDDIIDILLMYLNAGHESSGHITMWTTYFLQRYPQYLKKAKVSTFYQISQLTKKVQLFFYHYLFA